MVLDLCHRCMNENLLIYLSICESCKSTVANTCVVCKHRPWIVCDTCCDNFSQIKACSCAANCFHTQPNESKCFMFHIAKNCIAKTTFYHEWTSKAMPVISCFLNRAGKCWSPQIVKYLCTFLTAKDGFKLVKLVMNPILKGMHIPSWSPFSSFGGDCFVSYFKTCSGDFTTQLKKLKSLHGYYLEELFQVKKFRLYFPQMVPLSYTMQQQCKGLLPSEFITKLISDYDTRMKKICKVENSGTLQGLFEKIEQLTFLQRKLSDHLALKDWKRSYNNQYSLGELMEFRTSQIRATNNVIGQIRTVFEQHKNEIVRRAQKPTKHKTV